MPTEFASDNVDFDDLFDPDIVGNGPQATWLENNGVPLRYAALSYGTKRADVGYDDAGVDVSNLWAAKGTAVYFPNHIRATSISSTGIARSASMRIAIRTNGTIVVAGNGTNTNGFGTTTYGASSATFDFRISGSVYGIRNSAAAVPTITGKGGVNFSGTTPPGTNSTFDTGWQAAADDENNFLIFSTSTPSNGGLSELSGNLTIQIRRKSDAVVVQTMAANYDVSSDSQS